MTRTPKPNDLNPYNYRLVIFVPGVAEHGAAPVQTGVDMRQQAPGCSLLQERAEVPSVAVGGVRPRRDLEIALARINPITDFPAHLLRRNAVPYKAKQ